MRVDVPEQKTRPSYRAMYSLWLQELTLDYKFHDAFNNDVCLLQSWRAIRHFGVL